MIQDFIVRINRVSKLDNEDRLKYEITRNDLWFKVDSDMLLVKSENGKLTVEDSYSEGYGRPIKDAVQNVEQNVVFS